MKLLYLCAITSFSSVVIFDVTHKASRVTVFLIAEVKHRGTQMSFS
jgi:hypothetical protein